MLADCKKSETLQVVQVMAPMVSPSKDCAFPSDHGFVLDLSGVDCGELDEDDIPPETGVVMTDANAV
jgi:hypothetical protein